MGSRLLDTASSERVGRMAGGRRRISPTTVMVEKQSGGGKTDERETEVRLPIKNLPPYAMPPPATFGGVLVLARHVAGAAAIARTAASSCVAWLCSASYPSLFLL